EKSLSGASASHERIVPIDAGFANLAIFQFARGLHPIAGELHGAAVRKIRAARIAQKDDGAAPRAVAEPAEQPLGEGSLVAHVANEDDIPVARFPDDVFGQDFDFLAAPAVAVSLRRRFANHAADTVGPA